MELATKKTDLSQVFNQLLALQEGYGPSLKALRQRAFDRFTTLGWPTTKDETWRFTNPKPISQTAFQIAPDQPSDVIDQVVEQYKISSDGPCLVFVNGRFKKQHSQLDSLPEGCRCERLQDALRRDSEQVTAALDKFQAHAAQMGSLNTAFWEDGTWVEIAANADIEQPIHVLYVQTQTQAPTMVHPRVVVSAGRHSRAGLVETHVGLDHHIYWMNNVTQIHLDDEAQFTHYMAQFDNATAYHTANFSAVLNRSSQLTCHHILTGAKLMRNNLNVHLRGEGAACTINGLTLGHEDQVLDNHVEMNHIVPHCNSDQYFKTILDDKAHGIFGGRVVVFQEAQKTDAKQTNRNLLLSDNARIDTKPQLEIYADDVKCAHGATTGQIDEDQLFYLAARGLDPKAAREVLLYAFAHELLDRLDLPPLLDQVEKVLLSRFTQSQLIGG